MQQSTVFNRRSPLRSSRGSRANWQRRCRYFYLRLLRQRSSASATARGLAAGVFAGLFPLFGVQTIIGVGLATLFKGNRIIAAAATWVSNPLTYVPIFFFNFRVGLFTLGVLGVQPELPNLDAFKELIMTPDSLAFGELLNLGGTVSGALFLGCFIVGGIGAIASYVGGLWLFHSLQKRRRRVDLQ